MIIYIDIDQTICITQEKNGIPEYENAIPIPENINKANKLFDEGHTIIYWTARGTLSKMDYRELTEMQLNQWGVKYNELKFNKPFYDLFIDNKNINTLNWK